MNVFHPRPARGSNENGFFDSINTFFFQCIFFWFFGSKIMTLQTEKFSFFTKINFLPNDRFFKSTTPTRRPKKPDSENRTFSLIFTHPQNEQSLKSWLFF